MRLGPVSMEAVLPIPPASFINDDEILRPVLMEAVLPIPPVGLMYLVNFTGASIDRRSAPDTASNIGSYCIITGADINGCCAPDTASNYWIK